MPDDHFLEVDCEEVNQAAVVLEADEDSSQTANDGAMILILK